MSFAYKREAVLLTAITQQWQNESLILKQMNKYILLKENKNSNISLDNKKFIHNTGQGRI